MKKNLGIVIVVVLVVALLGGGFYISSHNEIVRLEEEVSIQESNIEVQLERRADLIPNLIETVKGYAKHEEKVIEDLAAAREKMVNAGSLTEKAEANAELSRALTSLNVVVENYPDLKASANFVNLQDELSGTENRIATARRDYNGAVKSYNSTIKKIPTSIVAGMMNCEEKDYFEADESKTEVPTVNFGE